MARLASVRMFLLFMLLAWITGSCALVDEDLSDVGEPKLTLAMSVKSMEEGRPVTTKMSQSITQDNGKNSFRGIEQLYILPFNTGTLSQSYAVTATDTRQGNQNVSISDPSISRTGLVENNNARLFDFAIVPMGTNRVLVYGEAKKSYAEVSKSNKHKNGALFAEGLNNPSKAGDIHFHLEPILDKGTMDEYSEASALADNILDKLNDVMDQLLLSKTSAVKSIYDMISVYSEDKILACSYYVFSWILSQIYSALTDDTIYNSSTLDDILRVSEYVDIFGAAIDAAGKYFPTPQYGIPEGSMGFWWNGSKFVRLINGVNIALVDPENYCYPPSLWYYANSPVQTSNDENVKNQFVSTNTWNQILGYYYKDGPLVNYDSKSVAVKDNLQYGVGVLELSFLEVEEGAEAEAAIGCPLTGIIIGDQKSVGFDFTPYAHTDEDPNPSRYIYDDIFENVLTIGTTGSSVQTLVLQTPSGQPVHFALEFMNNSRHLLQCQQGAILPNCKFYLAGELIWANATQPGTENLYSIFSQDHKTTVTVRIESLKKAYNTVPDLHDPQLEIGIEAEMKWVPVTPQSITIDL